MNLSQSIWKVICDHPRRIFLQTSTESLSYGSLRRQIIRTFELIDNRGLTRGDRVVIHIRDDYLSAAAWLACMLDGLIPVNISAHSVAEKVGAVVKATEAALILSDSDGVVCSNLPSKQQQVSRVRENLLSRYGFLARPHGREPRCDAVDTATAYLLFTSGTTGNPSGVAISIRALEAHLSTLKKIFGYCHESCIANATDLAHTDGLVHGLLVTCYSGATLFRPGDMTSVGVEAWLDRLAKFGASHLVTNPTALQIILKQARHGDYFKHSEFRAVISSASTLHASIWEAFEGRFSCEVCNLYGMTETVANATYAGSFPGMGSKGTIGKPIDCEVRVTDSSTGAAISTGVGNLEVRGSNIFDGYWRDEERTRDVLLEDGWFRTGDMASWDSEGNLHFEGRDENRIVSGGLTINPGEIDEVLLQHPSITKSVTVGIAHDDFGEIAVSGVEVCERTNSADLMRHARDKLEPLKVPKKICLLDVIPTGDSGKPKLAELITCLEYELENDSLVLPQHDVAGSTQAQVLAVAASVFCTNIHELSLEQTPDDLNAWDSFTHLTLLVEIERHFTFSIPTAKIAQIRSLGDIVKVLEDG